MTRLLAVILAGVLSLGLAHPALAADTPPSGPPSAVLTPLPLESGVAATAAGVSSELKVLLRKPGPGLSALIVDPRSETVLTDIRADRARIPASTLKILTAAAVLRGLGPATRLATTAHLSDDTVYLVGGGDPTLRRAGKQAPGEPASLKELARRTASSISPGLRVNLVYDDRAFRGPRLGPGWPRSFPGVGVVPPISALVVDGGRVNPGGNSRVSDPSRQAAELFATYLREEGIDVAGVKRGKVDERAVEIARVESQPVSDIVQTMLTDSENAYAESLAHLLGGKLLDEPTFAGGAKATVQQLSELGIDVTGLSLLDASGLSRENRVTPVTIADVLTEVARGSKPELSFIAPGLAVAGFTGTLADRFTSPATRPGRGLVQAKTGTLTGVNSLAGLVRTEDNGVLVFALIENNTSSLAGSRERMDRVAATLAQCGCS